jgi:hypothetical protein
MSIPNRYQRGNAGGGAAQRRRPIIEGPAEADRQCDATASNRMHGQDGGQRTYTIGKHGSPWSPDTARQEARRILGEVVKDADPVADKIAGHTAITVAELCGSSGTAADPADGVQP